MWASCFIDFVNLGLSGVFLLNSGYNVLARIPWKWRYVFLIYYIRRHVVSVCSITKHSVLKLFLYLYELWHIHTWTPTVGIALAASCSVRLAWVAASFSLSFATSLSGTLRFLPAIKPLLSPSKSHPPAPSEVRTRDYFFYTISVSLEFP